MTDVTLEIKREGTVQTLRISYEVDPVTGDIDIWKTRREIDKKIIQLTDRERDCVEDEIRNRNER